MNGLTYSQTPQGALTLQIDEEGREELREIVSRARHLDHDVLAEMLDRFQANGMLYPINPEFVFVGLTSAPVITDDIEYDEAGETNVTGNVWWYPDYQIRSFVDDLLQFGSVTFPLGAARHPGSATCH